MSDVLARQLALAQHYDALDQHERVLEVLKRAEEGALASLEYWVLRARALGELERHEECASIAAKGLELEPESVELLRVRSEALASLDRLAESERAILAALRLEPEEPVLLCSYARLVARGGQVDKAVRLLAEAERVEPDSPTVIATRLLLAHLRGEDAQAVSDGRELLSQAPDHGGSHYLAALSLERAGRAGEADSHFRNAARLEPVDPDFAEAARESRLRRHPLMWPARLLGRLSPAGVWLSMMAVLVSLRLFRANAAASILGWAYLALCVYTWVVPPALRYWLRRRQR